MECCIFLIDPLTQQELSGSEIRNLALRLSLPLTLPHPCHAIIARTDPDLVDISDVMDGRNTSIFLNLKGMHAQYSSRGNFFLKIG